ncbi:hypothetical protein ZWY2020_048825 [Hordeum vulgare]|nr:hypothetical protein ZWY2020_048825 [Hordeum vulgare]
MARLRWGRYRLLLESPFTGFCHLDVFVVTGLPLVAQACTVSSASLPSLKGCIWIKRYRGSYCIHDVDIKVVRHERIGADMYRDFAQEVYIMRKVYHRNVVHFMGACTRQPNLYTITDFMSGGAYTITCIKRAVP